jgi:Aspartate-semialdehyde dehydrogenase
MVALGVVGATGQVGQVVLSLLEEREFPVDSLRLFASSRTADKSVVAGQPSPWRLRLLIRSSILHFSAGGAVSRAHAHDS